MVPASIKSNLAALRFRERLLTFVWGAACWFAITLMLLMICCFADWLIDRYRDTPLGVRIGMFMVQAFFAAIAGLLFVFIPQIRSLPDTLLALWVEAKVRHFEHRLISSVQLNQPGADTGGMSKELIAVVTKETEKLMQRVGSFAQVADHRRLKWTGLVVTPLLLLAALPVAIWPGVCFALLARQLFLPYDIPHSVALESVSPEYWPTGEEIPIRFRVKGDVDELAVGSLSVTPEGRPSQSYPLRFITRDQGDAIFGADVEASSVNVLYSARLVDGRTKYPVEMQLVPRPIITHNAAFVQLPGFCGLRPQIDGNNPLSIDERRYESAQPQGEVVGIPGSSVRVQARVQKEIKEGHVDVFEKFVFDFGFRAVEFDLITEQHPLKISSDRTTAEARFDLNENQSAYRVNVKDVHGFANVPPPMRSVKLVAEEPPQVSLLRDSFSSSSGVADFDVEGLPLVIGGRVRIPYTAFGAYGLSKAKILYRVLEKHDSEKEPVKDAEFTEVTLGEEFMGPTTGPFDPKAGVFTNTPFDKQVPFHAAPSSQPDKLLGRTLGGGRYFLETRVSDIKDGKGNLVIDEKTGKAKKKYSLIDSKGKGIELTSGMQLEYCIEVYAANDKESPRPPGAVIKTRSETRVSVVMRFDEFEAWLRQLSKEDERVKELERQQQGVFGPR